MRVSLRIDSATTKQVRNILRVHNEHNSGADQPTVKLEGPEGWGLSFPPLTPHQASNIAFFGATD